MALLLAGWCAWRYVQPPVVPESLWDAVFTNQRDDVRYLLDHGASPNGEQSGILQRFIGLVSHRPVSSQPPPLSMAITNRRDSAIVRMLLEYGADPDAREDGTPVLMSAAMAARDDECKMLLDHGAKVDAADGAGRTALWIAAGFSRQSLAMLLLAHGANPQLGGPGASPLAKAQAAGHPAMFALLQRAAAAIPTRQKGH